MSQRWEPIGLEEARDLVERARKAGLELGKAMTIAVVDTGGFVVAVERMDGARPMTPFIAMSKAYSAAVMQRPTRMLKPWADGDPVFFSQVATMGNLPIVATEGGVTIKRDGAFRGGIGVAGGTAGEDQQICEQVLRDTGHDMEFAAWGQAAGGGTEERRG
jgi:uncharacterized protein GlcG (DUF336 family)